MSRRTYPHEPTFTTAASGAIYAGCKDCPDWIGAPASTPVEAAEDHWAHVTLERELAKARGDRAPWMLWPLLGVNVVVWWALLTGQLGAFL